MSALPLTTGDALSALTAHAGDYACAAAALGCSERTLYRRLRGHAVEIARLRAEHGWPSQTSAATEASAARAAAERPADACSEAMDRRRKGSRRRMAELRARARLARLSEEGRAALAAQEGADALASPALVTAWLRLHPEHDLALAEAAE